MRKSAWGLVHSFLRGQNWGAVRDRMAPPGGSRIISLGKIRWPRHQDAYYKGSVQGSWETRKESTARITVLSSD